MPLRRASSPICVLAAALLAGAPFSGVAAAEGQTAYLTHCAACHLDNGQGVPSAFPPLDERLGRWAATEAGRDYLVSAVGNGLFGLIDVNGVQYAGAMPQMRHLDAGELAGALTYALQTFGGNDDAAPFTADELTSRLNRLGSVQSRNLRPGD